MGLAFSFGTAALGKLPRLTLQSGITALMRPVTIALLLLLAACSPERPAQEAIKQAKPRHAKILQLSAANNQVERGQSLTLCYGVEDAGSVRLEPPEEVLGLSRSRCIAVSPKHNTTYTVIAKGEDGEEVRQSFPVSVVAAAKSIPASATLIRSFDVATGNPGRPLQLCYQTKGAVSLRLNPPVKSVEPSESPRCFPISITTKTTFMLTATDAAGNVDRMQVTASPLQ